MNTTHEPITAMASADQINPLTAQEILHDLVDQNDREEAAFTYIAQMVAETFSVTWANGAAFLREYVTHTSDCVWILEGLQSNKLTGWQNLVEDWMEREANTALKLNKPKLTTRDKVFAAWIALDKIIDDLEAAYDAPLSPQERTTLSPILTNVIALHEQLGGAYITRNREAQTTQYLFSEFTLRTDTHSYTLHTPNQQQGWRIEIRTFTEPTPHYRIPNIHTTTTNSGPLLAELLADCGIPNNDREKIYSAIF